MTGEQQSGAGTQEAREGEAQAGVGESRLGVTRTNIENWFTYHGPTQATMAKYIPIRAAAKVLAVAILDNVPPGPDQTVAIRKVREAVMTANQAIACDV